MRDSIAHYHNHLYAERDIERLNLALRLLGIIEENGCCEHFGKPFNIVKCKNKEDLYEIKDDPELYYTISVDVNFPSNIPMAILWQVYAQQANDLKPQMQNLKRLSLANHLLPLFFPLNTCPNFLSHYKLIH